jgi:hypothetical protein
MVNENHFRFGRKSLFNFWKTIYNFKNRKSFSEIKFLVLACMFDIRLPESSNSRSSESRRHRNPATSGHQNIDCAGLRRLPATVAKCKRTRFRPKLVRIQPWSEAGRIWPIWPKFGYFGRIRPNMFAIIRQRPSNSYRTLQDSDDSCIFAFRDFFVRTKCRKIFLKKLFFGETSQKGIEL